MKTYNLATIPGDGIGPEVVTQGLRVLDAVAKKYDLEFKKTNYELGAAYWHKTKETLPDSVMAELAKSDVMATSGACIVAMAMASVSANADGIFLMRGFYQNATLFNLTRVKLSFFIKCFEDSNLFI